MFWVLLAATLLPLSSAFLTPGGGGCGCAPPPPPPCPMPQLCLPQLPPPPPLCLPSLPRPCLPQLPMISLPSPCGCGRKKRAADRAPQTISGQSGVSSETLCNNPQIRRIILKNLNEDPIQSKTSIHSELKAKLGGNFIVVCSQGSFSFVADSPNYCIDGSKQQTCYVFQA
uniref:Ground-like domain-containing protein n=1 Tax=Ditylenchus dipsaci TaxID=166011 RepID=A0A915DXH0_9BILA